MNSRSEAPLKTQAKAQEGRKTAAAVLGVLASGICAVGAAPPVQNLAAQMADDSPRPRRPHLRRRSASIYTKRLLDGLQSRGIRATFFVVGENISGSEELIRRMAGEGHVIGNHTYSHIKLSGITDAEACGEVQKTDALVRELTGSGTEFIRPPFGSWKKTLECELEMIPVLWDAGSAGLDDEKYGRDRTARAGGRGAGRYHSAA